MAKSPGIQMPARSVVRDHMSSSAPFACCGHSLAQSVAVDLNVSDSVLDQPGHWYMKMAAEEFERAGDGAFCDGHGDASRF